MFFNHVGDKELVFLQKFLSSIVLSGVASVEVEVGSDHSARLNPYRGYWCEINGVAFAAGVSGDHVRRFHGRIVSVKVRLATTDLCYAGYCICVLLVSGDGISALAS